MATAKKKKTTVKKKAKSLEVTMGEGRVIHSIQVNDDDTVSLVLTTFEEAVNYRHQDDSLDDIKVESVLRINFKFNPVKNKNSLSDWVAEAHDKAKEIHLLKRRIKELTE